MELKPRQQAAVEQMLMNIGGGGAAGGGAVEVAEWSDQWKVLIYDTAGRDIIAPLLKVANLRRNGVTLHMQVAASSQWRR